jgi:hypothetical protein
MINKKFNHLFLTYDGLMDPLGKSQIIPYLKSISSSQRKINVISFEKINNIEEEKIKIIKLDLIKNNIFWKYSKFSNKYGKIGKIYDLFKMFFSSIFFIKKNNIKIIHCRSHIPALVGFFIKKILKIKLIFDFRGFWIEERFDYKIWDKKNILNILYSKLFKYFEIIILNNSDYIVCLTNSVKPYLNKIVKNKIPIEVIPCCADYDYFKIKKNNKNKVKKILNLRKDASIIGYAGSINQIYLIKKMILFFLFLQKRDKNLIFIFVTHQTIELKKIINKNFNKKIYNKIKIYKADRNKIPMFLSCFDLMISFIKNTFSRKAMSPTKMFEAFAMGIPFLCNKGIGDVDYILNKHKTGVVIDIKKKIYTKKHFELFVKCRKIKSGFIIKKTKPFYNIAFASERYNHIYSSLEYVQK